jgi:transglutaminase-like putative cysteine protease
MINTKLSLIDDRQNLGWLLGAVVLSAAPHVFNLTALVMVFFSLLSAWFFFTLYWGTSLPNKPLLFLLTLAGASLVLLQYHRIWGLEAGSSLFVIGLGLKLFEIKTQRDAYLVVFLSFFVILTQYLFSQSIPMAGYTLIAVILLVAAMIGLNSGKSFSLKSRLRMATVMVAQALPLMMLLFVFFPRIQGPLWILPDDSHTAKSGLSDTLSPGSFSHLALSHQTAFRVDFIGEPPPPKDRYWRGPVFWYTNGQSWSLTQTVPISLGHKPNFKGGFHSYVVTLEPHAQRWIFALDLPYIFPDEFGQTADYQLLSKADVTERKQYRITSGTVYSTGTLSKSEIKRGLQLPANVGNRLQELVMNWQKENTTSQQLVDKALQFFRQEQFYYTLNPPLLSGNPVESFLFETRRGFCEHYATAFVMLMRIGGVPARVVTGYQGGQWNSIGRFLEIKQADAHAWAEVWLPESGWTRIDPTAAVAPERIERGIDTETQIAFGEIRFNLGGGLSSGNGSAFGVAWKKARMITSSIDHAWDSFVLAYDTDNQNRFFSRLGLLDWQSAIKWLALGILFTLIPIAWLILPQRGMQPDPTKRIYQKFQHNLASMGLAQRLGEGPMSFADRIEKTFPEIGSSARLIIKLYVKIRYEEFHNSGDLKKLRRLVWNMPKPSLKYNYLIHKQKNKIKA